MTKQKVAHAKKPVQSDVTNKKWGLERVFPWLLVILATLGLLASFVLTVEKIHTLSNPNYIPSCNISPIISCGSVMTTNQASTFGIPNSLFGIIGFAVIAGIGGVLLTGVTVTKKWFWRAMLAATAAGALFSAHLIITSLYIIKTLCPYCMVVWIVMIALFWYTFVYTVRHRHIPMVDNIRTFINKYHLDILLIVYGAILFMILTKFWYYWKTLL